MIYCVHEGGDRLLEIKRCIEGKRERNEGKESEERVEDTKKKLGRIILQDFFVVLW